jgi:hypothetical protein
MIVYKPTGIVLAVRHETADYGFMYQRRWTVQNHNRSLIRVFSGLGGLPPFRVFAPAVCLFAVLVGGSGPVRAETTAQTSTPAEQEELSITIYNNDLGLVKDVRHLKVARGMIDLKFEGVAARIDPTSVHIRSLDHPGQLAVLEQNFEYDLISPAKLMEKYLGRDVELIVRKDKKDITVPAKLIGNQGGYVYEIEGKIAVNPPGRVVLPAIPEGLISKPTLLWMLESGRGEHMIEASYLTGGIGWKANYVVVLAEDDKRADLSGWVTIDNKSGATYGDASIKLVAGDVHRAPQEVYKRGGRRELVMDAVSSADQFVEKAFFEYHLYTLQRKSTIKDNQTKQISLLDAEDVAVKKSYVYEPRIPYWFYAMSGTDKSAKVGVFLSLENSKNNNLGMPLPKGVVRVYKKDDDDALQFVGEDAIDHTPEDETVRVKVGEAFDIVGERVQTKFRVLESGHLYESSYKVDLRNHKDERVVVSVVEIIPGDWEIIEKSHDFTKESSNRIRFDVPVEKKGSAELTYTVRIRY